MAIGDEIEPQSLKKLTLKSLKRTYELFCSHRGERPPPDPASCALARAVKIRTEYGSVRELPPQMKEIISGAKVGGAEVVEGQSGKAASLAAIVEKAAKEPFPSPVKLAGAHPHPSAPGIAVTGAPTSNQIVAFNASASGAGPSANMPPPTAVVSTTKHQPSAAVMKRLPSKWPRPVWHPPWKNYRVISGHMGWVRSVAFEPGNEWFCTGSADRTIKIWEVATGKLKLTLTGHIEQIRGLAVSPRHPYMFSAGDDKQVKCWDLEYNKVIRSYHGHLSGVYCLSLHPTLDVLMTGGRDSVCRVWDMRTKAQIFALSGHDNTVCSVITQATDPQVVTGSHDSTIKLWDLVAGKTMSTLTFHKKSVRALAMHPFERTFASASADNMKKFKLPKGEFLHNMLSQQRTIVNSMAINEDNVLASGGDNGSIWFWDWKSGHNFQQAQTVVQPGSLDSEAGIYALSFDITGKRLVTCEADKTIKMWKEDETATPESHPINFRPPKDMRRF